MKRPLSLSLIFLFFHFGFSQSWPAHLQIATEYRVGQTIKHRSTMVFDLPEPARTLHVDIAKHVSGEKVWHHAFHFPKVGWAFSILDYGNQEVLGQSISIHPYIDFPFFQKGRFGSYGRLAMGLAYNTRIFDWTDNVLNNAISTGLNNHTELSLLFSYRIHRRISFRLGGSISHQSNAKYRQPNLGLNSVQARYALVYHVDDEIFNPQKTEKSPYPPITKKWNTFIRLGLARKSELAPGGPIYSTYLLSAYSGYILSHASMLFGGLEWSYDMATHRFWDDHDAANRSELKKAGRFTMFVGNEFRFRRLGFQTQIFMYLDEFAQGRDFWGFKLGPNLYLFPLDEFRRNNFFVGAYLKTHYFIADYFEMTAGISF